MNELDAAKSYLFMLGKRMWSETVKLDLNHKKSVFKTKKESKLS